MADLIVADPPYAETNLKWDRLVPAEEWLNAARLSLADSGSLWCFGSARVFFRISAAFKHWRLAQDIIWEKHNGSNAHADRFRRVHELAYHFYPRDVPWGDVYKSPVTTNDARGRTVRRKQKAQHWSKIGGHVYKSVDGGPRLTRSVIKVRSCHGYAVNEAQKPVGIVAPLIEYSCPPGGLVLSPFMGSGTDLVAAKMLGRRAIGIEIREEQCEAAARRVAQESLGAAL